MPSAPPEEGSDFHAAPNRTAGPVVHAAPFARPVVDAAMSHGRLLSGINWASGAGSLRASSPVHECHPPVVHQTQPDAMWLLLLHETWSPASSECRRKSDHQPRRRGQRVRGHGAAQAGRRGAQRHPHAQPPGAHLLLCPHGSAHAAVALTSLRGTMHCCACCTCHTLSCMITPRKHKAATPQARPARFSPTQQLEHWIESV